MSTFDKLQAELDERNRRKEAEMKTLMKLTGKTVEELGADLTAPDPVDYKA